MSAPREHTFEGSRPSAARTDGSSPDNTGAVTHQTYDPFGHLQDTSPGPNQDLTRIGFTGHQQDNDLRLTDMGGRIYDPLAGRFLTPDPIMQAPYWSQGQNRYSYVFNDPINATDPSGFSSQHINEGISGTTSVAYLPSAISIAALAKGAGVTAGAIGASLAGGALNVGISLATNPFSGSKGGSYQVPSGSAAATTNGGGANAPVAVAQNRPPGPMQPLPSAAEARADLGFQDERTARLKIDCQKTPSNPVCSPGAGLELMGPVGMVAKPGVSLISRLLSRLLGRGAVKAPSAIEAVATGFGAKNAAIFERTVQIVAEKGGKQFVDHLGALAQAVGEKVPMGQVWKLGELGGKPIFGAVRNGLGIVETQAGTMIVHAPTGGTPQIIGPLIP